ncbi:hypothetical protein AGMMS49992_14410 [Clostridia bacterium]|nr:hypothetical protein AGMMS49992_14410 [Clostridia bacterium]
MPFISITTNQTLTIPAKSKLKSEAGRLISIIPTKSEAHLMVSIADAQYMTFGGTEKPCAFIAVHLYTAAPQDSKRKFVEVFVPAASTLMGVPVGDIFVNIMEHDHWGSGGTFH